MYAVKEIFYTLQGEGMNAGRPLSFAALPVATFGADASKIAQRRSAHFAIRILSARTDWAAENL